MGTVLTTPVTEEKTFIFNLVKSINAKIEKEKENAIGVSIAFVMIGTGLASITAALAMHKSPSMFILMTVTILAMATNAAVISQQPLKTVTWLFLVSIVVNTILLFYQVFNLLA